MLFPISLLQKRLNVEITWGNISFVGDGALDVPSSRAEDLCEWINRIAWMWSGMITYRSISTPEMFWLDNK